MPSAVEALLGAEVESTNSTNITLSWRHSARGTVKASGGPGAPAKAAVAARSLSRWPSEATPSEKRRTCFVYIDEAYDYFDDHIGDLLNQARKYKVGMILAHQNLDQLDTRLRADIMSSTSVKLAGGVSAKDARALAAEMRCEPEFVQGARKHRDHTEFACFVRNVTGGAVKVRVPFGVLEAEPRMADADFDVLLELNRARYGAGEADEVARPTPQKGRSASGFEVGEHEVL